MNESPLVSIITPTYNHSRFISECINSVIEQTYENWEMIIVDDGSSDNTKEIVQQFCSFDNRITLISQKNIGIFRLSETYNMALTLANGKYIAILEGDDVWLSHKLMRQISAIEKDENIVLAWGKVETIRGISKELIGVQPSNSESISSSVLTNNPIGSVFNILFFENPIPAVSMLIRKTALLKFGGFKQSFNLPLVDLPTIFELSGIGMFYYDNEVIARWREFGTQITKTYPVEILKGRWKMSMEFFGNLDHKQKSLIHVTEKQISQYYNKKLVISYARAGRYKLIRREFGNARKDYIKAIFYPKFCCFTWRLRALTGLVFSLFNMNVEGLSRKLGKISYEK